MDEHGAVYVAGFCHIQPIFSNAVAYYANIDDIVAYHHDAHQRTRILLQKLSSGFEQTYDVQSNWVADIELFVVNVPSKIRTSPVGWILRIVHLSKRVHMH